MTEIYYDTEFIEDGRTIELISIGMVRDDGAELYLINKEMPCARIAQRPWLMQNVVPHLPTVDRREGRLSLDTADPRVVSRATIRDAVRDFVLELPDPQLWAWYGAYDHVVLAQLFGRMIDFPAGLPMWTNDLRQEIERLGGLDAVVLPAQVDDEHHALADARWVAVARQALRALQG